MAERTELDYEPGPIGASYTRLGPPPTVAAEDPSAVMADLRYEVADESAGLTGRRRQHRVRRPEG